MTRSCLKRRAFGSLSDLTVEDALILLFPCTWTIVASCFFCYYTVHPVVNQGLHKTVPMYWSLISSFPAAVTAFNYYIFQRAAVMESGLSRFSIAELSQVMRLFGLLTLCCFIILATASGLQFAECKRCENDIVGENVLWLSATLFWMIIMACSSPTAKHFSKLTFVQETTTGGPQNVGRIFGRVAMTDDTSFMVEPQDSALDQFVRAGVHPDCVAQGKVARS